LIGTLDEEFRDSHRSLVVLEDLGSLGRDVVVATDPIEDEGKRP